MSRYTGNFWHDLSPLECVALLVSVIGLSLLLFRSFRIERRPAPVRPVSGPGNF